MAKILIVDPETAVQDGLAAAFAACGWQTELVSDAQEALALLEIRTFDVIVADPCAGDEACATRGDGCEWLRRVRALRPEAKVLVMTARHTPANVICALREQAYSYFSKPCAPRAVAEMVASSLSAGAGEGDLEVISSLPNWLTLLVRCKPDTADRLVQFLREIKVDIPAEQRDDIASALRELLLNAIEHGCSSDPAKCIRVSYIRTARAAVYHIQDPGPGFSFEHLEHTALGNPNEDPVRHLEVRAGKGVRPGGFGILLTRHLVDELFYNEKGNEVLFVKYLRA
ncbi:MAG: ATP-binding protein [Bryobacteraceae bacterium]